MSRVPFRVEVKGTPCVTVPRRTCKISLKWPEKARNLHAAPSDPTVRLMGPRCGRRYTKTPPALPGRRRLTPTAESLSEDIPANFDGREAFPECASVIGRVRDQSDCGSCWAFASTEVIFFVMCCVCVRVCARARFFQARSSFAIVCWSARPRYETPFACFLGST